MTRKQLVYYKCSSCTFVMLCKKGRACPLGCPKAKMTVVVQQCDSCSFPEHWRTPAGKRVCKTHLEQAIGMDAEAL